jgi:hypothetical protein
MCENRYASSRDYAAMGVTVDGSKLSCSSIKRMMKLISRRVNITPRPMITDQKHADAALSDAESLLEDDFTLTAHTDEKTFEVPGFHGRVCLSFPFVSSLNI